MSESTAEFADTIDGRVAKMLHAALRTIGVLEAEIEFKDALIRELKMALLMKQAEALA